MNPLDFLNTAKRLCADRSSEADHRSAISRAYYGIFNHIRRCLDTKGIKYEYGAGVHRNIEQDLHNCGIASIRGLSSRFRDLLSERTTADYNMDDRRFVAQKNVALLVLKAENVANLFDEEDLSVIAKGIKEYRDKFSPQ